MVTLNQLDGGVQQSILDDQGCSSQLPLDSYYEQENLGKVTVLAAVEEPNPVDGDVGSSTLMGNPDNRIVNFEHAGCSFTSDSTPLMNTVQDNLRVVGGRGAGSSGLTETHDVGYDRIVSSPIPQSNSAQKHLSEQPEIFIGTVKLQSTAVDNIAGAFLNSSRKTLHFVPPTKQNGEIIVRPTKEVVEMDRRSGMQRQWTRVAMEEIIEGGPWLFQGQPIVLQFWEQGMSLRRQKHTQVPVWIRLKHLPMEYWTDEGLSTVASGVGTPLYTDGITKECSRLDFARVCVMLNYTSSLPKHLIVISPILRDGKEDPKRVDIEYEWLPQRCKLCCSLGHVASTCPDSKKTNQGPPITIFVKKQSANSGTAQPERGTEVELTVAGSESKVSAGYVPVRSTQHAGTSLEFTSSKGKDIAIYNSYGVLASASLDNDTVIEFDDANHSPGPITRSPTVGPP
ncbi:hypothetical protein Sango_3064800 [Sesamum angolense]|uniref:DUF4283 domain-containing protein n=1 Tax=Sesamum angolense TaxID=2727404 RepID=A0AAE1VYZ8_9LAMI|nr:hypothetical protein Sango_3064800 [Sesamum angolense]